MTVSFQTGMQHMDGTTALEYARSREGDNGQGTDFARSQRQQQIVLALKQQVLSIGGIGKLPALLSALGGNVLTNLSVDDAEALYDLVKSVSSASILHVGLDDTNFLYECGYPTSCGASYLYAHDSTYATVAHFMQNVFADPRALAEKATVGIEDGTSWNTDPEPSTRWSAIFSQLGWTTADLGAAQSTATTEVIDQSGGKDAAVAKWFASYFGVPVTTVSPPSPGTAGSTDGVIVILGHKEENAFNNDPGYGS
jgi:hypothetical protein